MNTSYTNFKMSELSFAVFGTLVAALLIVLSMQPAAAATNLRAAQYMNANHPYYTGALKPFMEEVKERTNGEITFDFFPAGQLGKPADSISMLQSGIADIVFTVVPYHPQELPASQAISLPWGWDEKTSNAALWRATHEPGIIKSEWDRAGIVPLMMFSQPAYEFHTANVPLPDLESLEGLRIRSPGDIYLGSLRALGTSPIDVKSTEQYEALERGLIDATIHSFSSWGSHSLQEVLNHTTVGVKFLVVPGMIYATTPQVLESLTPEQRQIMLDAGRKYSMVGQNTILEVNQNELKRFKEEGVKVYEWSEADKQKLHSELKPVKQRWAKDAQNAGLQAQSVLEQISTFRAAAEKDPEELPDYSSDK